MYWREKIEDCLRLNRYHNPNANTDYSSEYVLIAEKSLVGLLLLVYCRRGLISSNKFGVSNIRASMVATGLLGVLGNKGAVGIRLECFYTSICFLCAHLHAGIIISIYIVMKIIGVFFF